MAIEAITEPLTPPNIPGYRLAAMSVCDHGHILSIRYEVIDRCEHWLDAHEVRREEETKTVRVGFV